MTSEGFTAVGFIKAAKLPVGAPVRVHRKVSGLPSGSLDAEPFNWAVDPNATVWSGPALAVGGLFTTTGVALTSKPMKLF